MKKLLVLMFSCCMSCFGLVFGEDHVVVEEIGPQESKTLKSPDFPMCCEAANITIRHTDPDGFIRLLFQDLDIPRYSILFIYDGPDSNSPPFQQQPRYEKGTWTRPVIASSGNAIFIKFKPGLKGRKQFVGFKAVYWSSNAGPEKWTMSKPFTDCPLVTDVVQSGEVNLETISLRYDPNNIHYRFYCVWQIKLPPNHSNMSVYVRIVDMGIEDGKITIRSGLTSDSPVLVDRHNKGATYSRDLLTIDDLNQPAEGFTSGEGLYIHLEKPLSTSRIHFVYGVFQKYNGESCYMEIDFVNVTTFLCPSSQWCIPADNKCNKLPNCQKGEDESRSECEITTTPIYTTRTAPTTTLTAKTTTAAHCFYGQRRCDDGSCVNYHYGKCKENCESSMKLCQDGSCIYSYERCPEDPCKDYKPNKCDGGKVCYYNDEKCDRVNNCNDGSDENSCSYHSSFSRSFLGIPAWFWIFILVPFGILIILCWMCCRKKNRSTTSATLRDAEAGNTRSSEPVLSGRVPHSGTSMHPVPQNRSPFTDERTPLNDISAPDPPSMASAPPPYEEVVASGGPPPPINNQLPSYNDAVRNNVI